jgi:hypothetical protein
MKPVLKLSLAAILLIASLVTASAKINNVFAPSLWGPYDKNGFANVLNAPSSHPAFDVQSVENDDGSFTLNIYRGSSLSQSFRHEATTGDIHLLDVNHDDYVDILVGPASPRTWSTVFLSAPLGGKFIQTEEEPSLNGHMLIKGNGKHQLVTKGSSSYCSDYYNIYSWEDNKPTVDEMLIVISDPSAYKEYGVTTKYTLVKGGDYSSPQSVGAVLKRTNKLKKLPKQWQEIIESFDNL